MTDEPTQSERQTREERVRLLERFGRHFAAGEVLYREGDPASHAYLLHEGRVRVLKRVRNVERSLMVLEAGALFGETALAETGTRSSSAVALSHGVALVLDPNTFDTLALRHPAIAIRIVEQLAERLRDAEDQIEIMMLGDDTSKVVSALLKLSGHAEGSIQLTVSPVDLGYRVGLDVDLVKRIVARLRDQGYLRIAGETVTIADLGALRTLFNLLGAKEEIRGERGV